MELGCASSRAQPCPAMPSHARAAGAGPAAGVSGCQVPSGGRRVLIFQGAAGARGSREHRGCPSPSTHIPLFLRVRFHSPLGPSAGCRREMIQIAGAQGNAHHGASSQPISLHTLLPPSSHESPAKQLEGQEDPSAVVRPPGSTIPSSRTLPFPHGVMGCSLMRVGPTCTP